MRPRPPRVGCHSPREMDSFPQAPIPDPMPHTRSVKITEHLNDFLFGAEKLSQNSRPLIAWHCLSVLKRILPPSSLQRDSDIVGFPTFGVLSVAYGPSSESFISIRRYVPYTAQRRNEFFFVAGAFHLDHSIQFTWTSSRTDHIHTPHGNTPPERTPLGYQPNC